ncbi:short-chain Z-isoprenyl diphosphate synthase [Propionibacterium cyclohexanicum]|mgnify:CR=1 FL=1|uniref:Isoprenyl transferase n=1 Tax=Propionibacterium cyclohexanicum TaxID=64702 RepID=A0A1H9RFZ2_9ACTN|nr:isoprenyl transferase [Propionibacterium cyclohexanicum]SER71676.1 short-chain Z-isoprenyl diphosphate synthase [Propionibacterium cyclohexanicum]
MAKRELVNEAWTRLTSSGLVYATYENRLRSELDPARMPQHIAVLADGNRRWARTNAPGQPLDVGYRAGADKLLEFVDWCDELGIAVVTLWVLSTDNLSRSAKDELGPLMEVIAHLTRDLVDRSNYRVMPVGDLELLPPALAQTLRNAEQASRGRAGTHVNVAVGYGGRHELRDAVRSLLACEAQKGTTLEELSRTLEVDQIGDHLYTKGQPDPDLIIRTSGEQRLSGFLPWQSAHSELYFCEALWPDFRRIDFYRALRSYQRRERRFGK